MNSIASEVIMISYQNRESDTLLIKEYLEKDLNLPSSFIAIVKTQTPCPKFQNAQIHLCLRDNEQSFETVKFDNEFNQTVLKSFWVQ